MWMDQGHGPQVGRCHSTTIPSAWLYGAIWFWCAEPHLRAEFHTWDCWWYAQACLIICLMRGDREAKFSGTALIRPDLHQCHWKGCRCLEWKPSTGYHDAMVGVSLYTQSLCTDGQSKKASFKYCCQGMLYLKQTFFFKLYFFILDTDSPCCGLVCGLCTCRSTSVVHRIAQEKL